MGINGLVMFRLGKDMVSWLVMVGFFYSLVVLKDVILSECNRVFMVFRVVKSGMWCLIVVWWMMKLLEFFLLLWFIVLIIRLMCLFLIMFKIVGCFCLWSLVIIVGCKLFFFKKVVVLLVVRIW